MIMFGEYPHVIQEGTLFAVSAIEDLMK